jgi:lipopolysaccharide biosynthesis glycosyltransferase
MDRSNREIILKIFIGWDSKEDAAYQACKKSLQLHSSIPLNIIPIKQQDLRQKNIYARKIDPLSSTEFTFTRFLVPQLNNWNGWALYVDCDFIFLDDVKKLFDQADDRYALMCVQHDYKPTSKLKMDGKAQHVYPRKNWSSAILFNCSHPAHKQIHVNDETKDGKWFHRFNWLDDSEIGAIDHEWNWLVGWYKEPEDGSPKALHYTEGGPWFEEYKDCEYSEEYKKIISD